ncbi:MULTISPECIES: NO-inducible flavohemoprotein [Xanthomonas]|uniref:nitric oxide dioxygenase n=1 Tax=Xanthomonas cucurbitae TaxID=56453 RepID=A0A2S7DUQ7_9XANT|nr:NO-inducible flavohemoprotein [Xanthomonas cucurbitae]PPU77520.1 nitric oxide dioxygenase [Xanthomonas cucurbitae]QHG86143.1 NO-inducible flavohemoprotein [Xanthomonas cucurbitae]WDM68388.1 NO-inducible flavohemoprotein [Xanthomonas cucurbitae]WDM72261.1 NO-inducible flavohemoprotein [Xanthomonas cucurbitae]WDM76056.1 NO-inducible flavohemoprotein [Xanthomonas cucurbitae]
MLSEIHRATVASTVPLLEQGGEALITHFYKKMLADHPEVRPYFNAAHQANGDQPRALANGVLMYARHIERLEALGPLATQIVNKHVALQIQPEHYPIVGNCLIAAIAEVLGPNTATVAVLDAWAAAYAQLAQILIDAESARYAEQEAAHGGWRGGRDFTVVGKTIESAEITSFYLAPLDQGPVMDFQPGQYIGLHLWIQGQEHRRNYSLSAPPNGKTYRVSIKREAGGVVSNHLHDSVDIGDTLELNAPSGAFTLVAGTRPIVLISGGVGITPMLPMLAQGLETGRPITFIHCARNRDVHAFKDRIDAAAAAHPQLTHYYCYDTVAGAESQMPHGVGLLDAARLSQWMPADTSGARDVDVYFLGPRPFMRMLRRQLSELGVPDAQVRFEFFGPASALQ